MWLPVHCPSNSFPSARARYCRISAAATGTAARAAFFVIGTGVPAQLLPASSYRNSDLYRSLYFARHRFDGRPSTLALGSPANPRLSPQPRRAVPPEGSDCWPRRRGAQFGYMFLGSAGVASASSVASRRNLPAYSRVTPLRAQACSSDRTSSQLHLRPPHHSLLAHPPRIGLGEGRQPRPLNWPQAAVRLCRSPLDRSAPHLQTQ